MYPSAEKSRLALWFEELRAPFFSASIVPVLVGTSLAYAAADIFNPVLFVLALIGMVSLHAGANIANDYFDHKSGNDWMNKNVTPFSGGSQLIQKGLLSPQSVLIAALIALSIGGIVGIAILYMVRSVFILVLGLVGLLGGFFYTAPPIQLGYRGIGEVIIGLLFGLLPVYGSYYLQVRTIDLVPVVPGVVIGILVFLIILVNEFPDAPADSAVNKKTLVVVLGEKAAASCYIFTLLSSYGIVIVGMIGFRKMVLPGLLYLVTFPLTFFAIKSLKQDILEKSGRYTPHQITILLHLVGGVMLSIGFLLTGLLNK